MSLVTEGPPQPRAVKTSVKRGIAYEKKVGRLLKKLKREEKLEGELFLGQWLLFEDKNGVGRAQPDAYLVKEDFVLVVECKLTQTEVAEVQLRELYGPLLRFLYKKPVVLVQAFKNMRQRPDYSVRSLMRLKARHSGRRVYSWHYMEI